MTVQSLAPPKGGWTGYLRAHSDPAAADPVAMELTDLLDAVDVPIVVVRRNFTIACFNRAAAEVLGLDASHVDRSPSGISLVGGLPDLEEWCAQAIAAATPSRHDVRDADKSFVLRISPYLRSDRQITGAVLTFTNVTAFRATLDQAIRERENAKAILNTVAEPLVVLGPDLRVQTANRAFYGMFQLSREQAQNVAFCELGNRAFDLPRLHTQLQRTLAGDREFQPIEIDHDFPAIGTRTVVLSARQFSQPGQPRRGILVGLQDVTARKQAERELCDSEHRLRAVLEALPAAVYTTDAEGRITMFNKAAVEFSGRVPQLGSDSWCVTWKLYWPDGRPLPHDECPMAVALKTGRPVRGAEAIAERPDGTRVWFEPYPTPLHDETGKLVGAINMLVDITARKASEAAVRTQRRRFETLNRMAKRISGDLNLERIVQRVTDVATELSGARFGAFFYNVTGPHGESYQLYALSGVSREGFEKLGMPRNGALFDATFRATGVVRADDITTDARFGKNAPPFGMPHDQLPVASYLAVPVGGRGKVHGGLFLGHPEPGVFTQESEEIVAGIAAHAAIAIDNAHLYQAGTRLAAVVETSIDAIISKDLNGVITTWNKGAERLFGYTADEMIGKSIAIVIPADRHDEESRILDRIRRGQRIEHFETVRVRKDGTLVEVSLGVSPLVDVDGVVVGASKIARDIGERKLAQARQELLTREIQHRTKNLFAVVQAVIARSFAGKQTVEDAKTAVLSRLHSLAQTHVILVDQDWRGADIGEVVRAEMSPYAGRVTIEGPPLMLNAKAAQNFSLALHELATNAGKYGALSCQAGHVDISWSVLEPNTHRQFIFRWQERDGPPVVLPAHKGFGTAVLEQVMAEYFEAPHIDFAASGVSYQLRGSLDALTQ